MVHYKIIFLSLMTQIVHKDFTLASVKIFFRKQVADDQKYMESEEDDVRRLTAVSLEEQCSDQAGPGLLLHWCC